MLAALLFVAAVALPRGAEGDVSVPASLQAQLVSKVALYDRNFAARANGNALVLVVQKGEDPESTRAAFAMASELRRLADLGGVAKTVDTMSYSSATDLASAVRGRRASIVYLSVGLEGEAPAIAGALAGGNVLTVGATARLVEAGANVGFDLVGSKPKIFVNIATARSQGVQFAGEFLRLARIVGRAD
jgi:hypothetical protein